MTVIDVENVTVHVAAAAAGPFAEILDIESYDATHGSEGETRRRVFGRPNPYVRSGDLTDEYSLSGLYNPEDTDGQNVLRTARDTRSPIFIAVMHGEDTGYMQECNVSEYTDNGAADGEWVECSFNASAIGERTAVTAALP